MMNGFALSSLLLSLLAAVALAQQQPTAFTRRPWNIKGQLLVLDAGSLSFQGNHPMFPPFNADGCAEACARTRGCNAWTHCDSKEGCGSGCQAYKRDHPSLSQPSGPDINPTAPDPAWRNLSTIKGFGPWGVTGNCKVVCKEGGWPCEPGDRWPYGMCSLKQLADPGKPEFWSKDAAEGFVSGHANPPAECAGLTLRTCARCAGSKDPVQCRKCARNPALQLSMLESLQTLGPSRADGCGSCFNSTNPTKCVECLVRDAPCALCALQDADATVDVAACIDCTQKHGDRFKAACNECASLGAKPQQVGQCMSCLDAMEPLACNSRDFQPGCWNPQVGYAACRSCASRAADFGVCLDCMRSSPYSANCESCAGLEPGKQGACYNCSRAAAHPGSGCADCLQNVADPAQLQQCVGCLTNPRIGGEGKSWCYGCMNWCSEFGGRAQCVACLATPQDAYMRACAC